MWETAVGVALDRLVASTAFSSDVLRLPFSICVNIKNKPAGIGDCNDERLRCIYMNTLKQAAFLRFASANPIMEMSKSAQSGLWEGLKSQNVEQVRNCLQSTNFDTSEMKFVPVRLIVESEQQSLQFRIKRCLPALSGERENNAALHDCQNMVTLRDLLMSWVPNYPINDDIYHFENNVVHHYTHLHLNNYFIVIYKWVCSIF